MLSSGDLDEEPELESVPHEDHFTKYIMESIAMKKLHAAHDLNQIFYTGFNQVSSQLEEWRNADGQSNSNFASFPSVLEKVQLILDVLQNTNKTSYWVKGQNEYAIRLLTPADWKLQKLVRKLERLSNWMQDKMRSLEPITSRCNGPSSLHGSAKPQPAESSGQTLPKSPSVLKTLRKSLRNVFGGSSEKKKPTSLNLKQNGNQQEEDVDEVENVLESSPKNRSTNAEERKIEVRSDSDLDISTSEEFTPSSALATRQMAVIETDLFISEDGNGEAKEVVAEMNRQALIEQIVSEADAKWRPAVLPSDSGQQTHGCPLSAQDDCLILHASSSLDKEFDSTRTQNIIQEYLYSSLTSPPPELTEPLQSTSADNANESNDNHSRHLLSILKTHAKDLETKVNATTLRLREMEQSYYTLQHNADSQFTLKSERHDAQELTQLVNIVKEVGKLFLDHPLIETKISRHILSALQIELSKLQLNGNKFCAKLDQFCSVIKMESGRLHELLNLRQKGDLYVYEYSSNFGLNSFSNFDNRYTD